MIGDEIVIDGSHFIIEEVNGDYVSMRDVTFAENAGFPIFRRERIADILPLIPEKEEPVVEILPAPPQKPKSRVRTFDLHPEIPLEARHNYNFADKEIENVGKKERFRRNIEAINVLKECEFEGRFATPEEQEILSQYVGWGGIPEAFDANNSAWADEYKELIVALSPEEYDAAMESTLTAFYTPQTVISAIYKTLENLGFKQGNILEPACGIGNFIGMLPDSLKDCKMYGVELDSISGRIARQLYQKSSIAVQGYENTNLPNSFFDVAVGNVPFIHHHKKNEEIYFITAGSGHFMIDGTKVELSTGDWVKINPDGKRQIFAGDKGISYVCIQVKAGSLEGFALEDGVIDK